MMFSEMMGIIMIVVSIGRIMHLAANGFELRYRKWVKKTIFIFWGLVFAVGVVLMGMK